MPRRVLIRPRTRFAEGSRQRRCSDLQAHRAWRARLRELLGEDFELEASFLEESWVSGRSIISASVARKRDQVAENDDSVTFAELNTLGSFFLSPANGWMGDRPAYACLDESMNSYRAA